MKLKVGAHVTQKDISGGCDWVTYETSKSCIRLWWGIRALQ